MSSQSMPLLSVITVCFNAKRTIENTIKSVEDCGHPAKEHVIVDGVSTDGTIDLIKNRLSNFHRFVSEPDNGLYDAMNKGVRFASEDAYLVWINADDELLQFPTEVISKNSDVDCFFFNVEIADENGIKIGSFPLKKKQSADCFNFFSPGLHHQGMIIRKSAMKGLRYPTDIGIHGDVAFFYQVISKKKYMIVDIPIARIRLGGLSDNENMSRLTDLFRASQASGMSPLRAIWLGKASILRILVKAILGPRFVRKVRSMRARA